MEALIYNESPIAEYLEADAVPFEAADLPQTPPRTFAPQGLPKLQERLRAFRQSASSATDVANEKFLERFRYTIVASQLLQDDPKPRRHMQDDEQTLQTTAFSTRGAIMTAGISFLIAWFLQFLRRRYQNQESVAWSEICLSLLLILGGLFVTAYIARRQYLEFIRRSAGLSLAKVVAESYNLDTVTSAGLRFIQEVEVVSRGYEISHPMPPISRLEDHNATSRCRELRAILGTALTGSISQSVDAHNFIQPFIRELDLKSYHDIYEVSMQDYTDAVIFANNISREAQDSLKELRFLFRLHLMARKVFLCDLLALHTGSTWYNIRQWRRILQLLQESEAGISRGAHVVRAALVREEFGDGSHTRTGEESASNETGLEIMTPQKRHTMAQMRRFDAVVNSIRSLNAKVHLLKEEMQRSSATEDDSTFSMAITRSYESLGAEIRSTLSQWEKGRNTMFLNMDADLERRSSRASSDIRSPGSPSPSSLGGLTIVDGGPAEAFRLLSGDERGSSDGGLDEEVFEAVAMPRKRMSWTPMSREEKLSKLQQDRKKRATMQEHADNTTNMLRELQMVIKHRPNMARPETRVTSI
ncbi:uncharacterized protein PV06_06671 [Exophiala oligosperma]|uniref:Myosin-binding domain-containing protein n=1 Tax=Exophiala oligosperma TaxID=215243 RepID=A0A0D2BUG3_9EURO|nr:uncharacterized protein PV06_06671 [Exophiala oligosperma]KIW41077.1 hypothetical protein PV06_06671 [Exophiala oligosperma]